MNAAIWGAVPVRPPPARFLQRGLPWLLAVALHAALLALWNGPQRPPARPEAAPLPFVVQLQLLPAPPEAAPEPVPAQATPAAAATAPARPAQAARRLAPTPVATAPTAARATSGGDMPTATSPGEPATAAVTDAAPAPSLLDTPATRQALRAVATGSSLRAQSDAAVGAARPSSPEERLGQDIARAARADCLKGEFYGGGAGLLSLPFWLAAEAGGKCRR